jgi:hypothetical protein
LRIISVTFWTIRTNRKIGSFCLLFWTWAVHTFIFTPWNYKTCWLCICCDLDLHIRGDNPVSNVIFVRWREKSNNPDVNSITQIIKVLRIQAEPIKFKMNKHLTEDFCQLTKFKWVMSWEQRSVATRGLPTMDNLKKKTLNRCYSGLEISFEIHIYFSCYQITRASCPSEILSSPCFCSEMKWTLYWKRYFFFHYANVVFRKLEIPF